MSIKTLSAPTNAGRVLVVDDHAEARRSMTDVLSAAGHRVECLSSAVEALQLLERESYDVVVTDLQMPGLSGLDFIKRLEHSHAGVQTLMVTAHATVSSAVEAMRHGAFDYIQKPFSVEQLEGLVASALERGRMLDKGPSLAASQPASEAAMIGSSVAMQKLRARIAKVAPTRETVLIVGESGTGKELVARALHDQSDRRQAALVSLNCPVLSAQLMESELFGHERGAFTGADAPRTGRFELAHGGTILLDEVTEIELSLQAKLLRVLQERCFERVGSSRTQQIDVRVLAATNRDLQAEVVAGRFREDLYYRLNVVPIEVPPLRDRREDVPELIELFLARTAKRLQQPPCEVAPDALDLLTSYHWPGNVRKLENVVTRTAVLNLGLPIAAEDVRDWLMASPQGGYATQNSSVPSAVPVGLSMCEMERQLIEATLERFGGHRAKTAEALGIGLRTLSGKLKEYGYGPRTKHFQKAS